MITLDEQINFYARELDVLDLSVKEDFYSTATALKAKGKLYRGLYTGYDPKRGNIFIDFKQADGEKLPRLDNEYMCFIVNTKYVHEGSWGRRTYKEFISDLSEHDLTEVKLVNYTESKSGSSDRITGIFNDVSPEFLDGLKPNTVVLLGPKEPPYDYLINLKKLTEEVKSSKNNNSYSKLLNFDYNLDESRFPETTIDNDKQFLDIITRAEKEKIISIQGPPGTGKTYLIAQVIAELLSQNNSVLLTAQTNKAVVEVCNKDFLKPYLEKGLVHKRSLKTNEIAQFPKLQPISQITALPGSLILSTYYTFSNAWEEFDKPIFDYVIVEEASQAFLTTIAGALKLGQKVIIVGDSYQIEPIVNQNRPERIAKHIFKLINGLETFVQISDYTYLRKVISYRLTSRSVIYTNQFYENTLKSANNKAKSDHMASLGNFEKFIHSEGGPTLIKLEMPYTKEPASALKFLKEAIQEIDTKQLEVAILTPFVDTAQFLQAGLLPKLKGKKVLIETVDRVQGLDVDICFYVIPDATYDYSLNRNRYNVATSRAKLASIIIGSKTVSGSLSGSGDTLKYLANLEKEFSFDQ
jgi:DNA replication ATP-dependent helicase Dna2